MMLEEDTSSEHSQDSRPHEIADNSQPPSFCSQSATNPHQHTTSLNHPTHTFRTHLKMDFPEPLLLTELPLPHLTDYIDEIPHSPLPTLEVSRLTIPLYGPQQKPITLGRGTFGQVFAALLDTACPVAVKVLRVPQSHRNGPAETRKAAVAARQFRREVRRYAALHSVSGVVHFYGVTTPVPTTKSDSDSAPVEMFVTERMRGGSLQSARGSDSIALDTHSILRVLSAVAGALADIHRRGFSHGDIKPANVLFSEKLSRHGGRVTDSVAVKLVDFGLSRSFRYEDAADEEEDDESVRSASSRASRASSRGSQKSGDLFDMDEGERAVASLLGPLDARGTPAYLSPEAWCGAKALQEREVAQKGDVYALAMIMYELETKMAPWAGLSEWGIFGAVCNSAERPEWPKDCPETLPGLRALVERCWAQDYRERPSSQEVSDKLAALRERFERSVADVTEGGEMISSSHSSPLMASDTLPIMRYISDLGPSLGLAGNVLVAPRRMEEVLSNDSNNEYTQNGNALLVGDARKDLETGVKECGTVANPNGLSQNGNTAKKGQADITPVVMPLPSEQQKTLHQTSSSVATLEDPQMQSKTPTGLSIEEASTNGGYEADFPSQPTMQQSDQAGSSSRPIEEADNDHARVAPRWTNSTPNERIISVITLTENETGREEKAVPYDVPERVRSLEYAFKKEVMNNDITSLCAALVENERKPKDATLVLEALCVILECHLENCEEFVRRGGLQTISTMLSRYGSKEARLCKAACVTIFRLSICESKAVETELRSTGACEVVLNSIRWHPTKLPVVQNAAFAINAMCRASPALCSIVLSLRGNACALRVVARSTSSFQRDVPVALSGLEVIHILAKSHPSALTEDETITQVLKCCDAFQDEKVDVHTLGILSAITKHPTGQDKLLSTPKSMAVLAALMDRVRETENPEDNLATAFIMVSRLASSPKKPMARTTFMSSDTIEAVVQGIEACDKPSEQNVREHSVASTGLECMRSMTGLGKDVCGSLQISKAFQLTRTIINNHPNDQPIALKAVLFLKDILKELQNSSLSADLDVVFETLVHLQTQWAGYAVLARHITEAKQIVVNSDNDENCRASSGNGRGSFEAQESRRSLFHVLSRRKSGRNR